MTVSIPLDLAPVSDSLESPGGTFPLSVEPSSQEIAPQTLEDPEVARSPGDPEARSTDGGHAESSSDDLARSLGLPTQGEPEDLLAAALDRWPSRLVLATSLQAEGLVMLDLLHRRNREALAGLRVITLDTGRLPEETHGLIDAVRARYGMPVEIHAPDPGAIASLVANFGSNGFRDSIEARQACCRVRKVEPLQRALEGAGAWISGLRRDQSVHRGDVAKVELDAHGRVKLNPLADWSWERVWTYVRRHSVPYHPFYDRGYTSIGCAPCTRAIRPWEDRRAGRWWWEAKGEAKECGLHWARPARSEGAPTEDEVGPESPNALVEGDES